MTILRRVLRWTVFPLVLSPAGVEAQTVNERTERALAPSFVLYDLTRSLSQTPKSALGVSALIGRPLGSSTRVRLVLGVWASLPGGDPVSICSPVPGGCALDPVVPDRLWMGEFQAVVRVLSAPLYAVGGAGISVPEGADESLPSTSGLLRVGLEVGDGQRWRGIRLQLTRVIFPSHVRDLRSGQGLGILFRL